MTCIIKCQSFCSPNHIPPAAVTLLPLADTPVLSISFHASAPARLSLPRPLHCHFFSRECSATSSRGWFFNHLQTQPKYLRRWALSLYLYKVPSTSPLEVVLYHKTFYFQGVVTFSSHRFTFYFWAQFRHEKVRSTRNRGHVCLLCSRHCPNSYSVKLKLLRNMCQRLKDMPRVIHQMSSGAGIGTQMVRTGMNLTTLFSCKD